MEFLDTIRAHWGIIVTVFGSAYAIIRFSMDSKYVRREELGRLKDGIESNESRLTKLETKIENLPTAQDVAKLEVLMTAVKGQTETTSAQIQAVSHQVGLLLEAKILKDTQ